MSFQKNVFAFFNLKNGGEIQDGRYLCKVNNKLLSFSSE